MKRLMALRVDVPSIPRVVISPAVLVLLLVIDFFIATGDAQLHFASIGNWGTGSSAQYACGKTLNARAVEQPITYMLSPGSNFIGGVHGLNDTKWSTAFAKPYEHPALHVPFLTVLGAEDWKANYTAQHIRTNITYGSGLAEVAKTGVMPIWTLPNAWYHISQPFTDSSATGVTFGRTSSSVIFVMIDTHVMSDSFALQNVTTLQWDTLKRTLTTAVSLFDWVIVVGDKAILSSGTSKGDSYLSNTLRQLLRDTKVDAYISGNDYDMEIIEDGTLLHVNCGTGSGFDPIPRVPMDNSFYYTARLGFCFHTLTKTSFKTDLVDGHTGEVLSSYVKASNNRKTSYFDRFNMYQNIPQNTYIPIEIGGAMVVDEGDLFLRICGSLGLVVLLFFSIVLAVVFGSRVAKMAS